jgi:hypothetical protein
MLEQLRTFLIADAPLQALVVDRVHPLVLPQKPALPAITLQTVSALEGAHSEGADGLARPRVQIDAWSERYRSAVEVADRVKALLHGYRGALGDRQCAGAFFADRRDLYEADAKLHRVSQDFHLWLT